MIPREKLSRLEEAKKTENTAARARLTALFDEGSFTELDPFCAANVVTGYGCVDGQPVYAFAQNAGALCSETALRISKLYAMAVKTGTPVVGIYDAIGASLTEGMDLLAAYGSLLLAANNLSGVVPQIAVVTGVCAGTSAMLAAAADVLIVTNDAELFLAAPSASGADAAKAGLAHLAVESADEAIAAARRLAGMLPSNNLSAAPLFDYADADLSALCDVEPDAVATMNLLADAGSLIELSAGFATEAATALGTVAGQAVGFVAVSGAISTCACKKLARFVRFCDAFNLPILTLVDTEGFADAADVGAVQFYAKLAHVYAEATTAKVAMVIGKAYGPAYIALAGKAANADLVFAWPNAAISALKPETAVSILYNDQITYEKSRNDLIAEYLDDEASAFTAADRGVVDAVISPADTRSTLIAALDMLAGKRESKLPKKHSVL